MKLYQLKEPKLNKMDYCPRCRARTPHLKLGKQALCKRCGRQYLRQDIYGL